MTDYAETQHDQSPQLNIWELSRPLDGVDLAEAQETLDALPPFVAERFSEIRDTEIFRESASGFTPGGPTKGYDDRGILDTLLLAAEIAKQRGSLGDLLSRLIVRTLGPDMVLEGVFGGYQDGWCYINRPDGTRVQPSISMSTQIQIASKFARAILQTPVGERLILNESDVPKNDSGAPRRNYIWFGEAHWKNYPLSPESSRERR